MASAVEKAISEGLTRINSHFKSKDKLDPESKDGIVVQIASNFEEGGIVSTMRNDIIFLREDVNTLKEDVGTLKGHFSESGVIHQILNELKQLRSSTSKSKSTTKYR